MLELKLPTGENSVLLAYDEVRENAAMDAEEMAVQYAQNFGLPQTHTPDVRPLFERFSLVDPTIRTVIQSSTTTHR